MLLCIIINWKVLNRNRALPKLNTMANPGTVIAHIAKLVITIGCMNFFKDSFSLRASEQAWAVRAFQILLAHSVLGILRFGKFLLFSVLFKFSCWIICFWWKLKNWFMKYESHILIEILFMHFSIITWGWLLTI